MITAAWVILTIGHIWLIVNAFRTTIWWGIGAFFLPPVAFIFGLVHWGKNRTPMLMWIIGFLILAFARGYWHQSLVYI